MEEYNNILFCLLTNLLSYKNYNVNVLERVYAFEIYILTCILYYMILEIKVKYFILDHSNKIKVSSCIYLIIYTYIY